VVVICNEPPLHAPTPEPVLICVAEAGTVGCVSTKFAVDSAHPAVLCELSTEYVTVGLFTMTGPAVLFVYVPASPCETPGWNDPTTAVVILIVTGNEDGAVTVELPEPVAVQYANAAVAVRAPSVATATLTRLTR
jgi:hypothetical protein